MVVELQKKNKLQLPDEMVEKLEWNVGDTILVSEQADGTIILKKVVELAPGDVVEVKDKVGNAVVLAGHVSDDEYDKCVIFFPELAFSQEIYIEACTKTGDHYDLPWLKKTEIKKEFPMNDPVLKDEEKADEIKKTEELPVSDKAEIKDEPVEKEETYTQQDLDDVYDLFA